MKKKLSPYCCVTSKLRRYYFRISIIKSQNEFIVFNKYYPILILYLSYTYPILIYSSSPVSISHPIFMHENLQNSIIAGAFTSKNKWQKYGLLFKQNRFAIKKDYRCFFQVVFLLKNFILISR
jgi:hypothetical protein